MYYYYHCISLLYCTMYSCSVLRSRSLACHAICCRITWCACLSYSTAKTKPNKESNHENLGSKGIKSANTLAHLFLVWGSGRGLNGFVWKLELSMPSAVLPHPVLVSGPSLVPIVEACCHPCKYTTKIKSPVQAKNALTLSEWKGASSSVIAPNPSRWLNATAEGQWDPGCPPHPSWPWPFGEEVCKNFWGRSKKHTFNIFKCGGAKHKKSETIVGTFGIHWNI